MPTTLNRPRRALLLPLAVALVSAVLQLVPGTGAVAAPSNDAFADAEPLTLSTEIAVDTRGATLEEGEPTACDMASSVWYRFVAPSSEWLHAFLTIDSVPVLAVYEGASLADLREIACDDNASGGDVSELSMSFAVQAGKTYYLRLDGDDGTGSLEVSRSGAIGGTVTTRDGGSPFICVSALSETTFVWKTAHLFPGETGYRIENLPPADDYTVEFNDCGSDSPYATEWYDDRPSRSEATPVPVEAGVETTDIDAVLGGFGTISGSVADAAGTPLGSVCVDVLGSDGRVAAETQTDASGSYELSVLDGTYRVRFVDCVDGAYMTEWFDDASHASFATTLDLAPGDVLTGISAALELKPRIEGVVTGPDGTPLPGICVEAWPVSEDQTDSTTTGSHGSYALFLNPGDYQLRFRDCGEGTFGTEWFDDRPTQSEAEVITLTASGQVVMADAQLGPALGTIKGTVFFKSERAGSVCIELVDASEEVVATMTTNLSGLYEFGELPAGTYRLHLVDCEGSRFPAQWYSFQTSFAGARPIALGLGEHRDVRVILGGWGSIWGEVRDDVNDPIPGLCVVALDEEGEVAGTTETVSDGSFKLEKITPDSYRLRFGGCEPDEDWASEWWEDRPDLATADPVEIPFTAHTSRVVLPAQQLVRYRIVLNETGGSTRVTEGGSTDSVHLRLSAPPEADVTLEEVAATEAHGLPGELVFTPEDWDVPREVEIEAGQDPYVEAPVHSGSIRWRASSSDPHYDGREQLLSVDVEDNDVVAKLEYAGPTEVVRGAEATLTAWVTTEAGAPVVGEEVVFQMPEELSAVTDADGRAHVTTNIEGQYGTKDFSIVLDPADRYEPTFVDASIEVVWEHVFADGDAEVRINTIREEFQFAAPGDLSPVAAGSMTVGELPTGETRISIDHAGGNPTVRGEFFPDSGRFVAVVQTPHDTYLLTGLGQAAALRRI